MSDKKRPQSSTSSDEPTHKIAKRPGRGVRLTSQSKYIVENVREFFETEKRTGKSILRDRVLERTAQATGVSRRTVASIHASMTEDKQFLTPVKRYTASRVRINLDAFDRELIRRTVHSFYD